MSSGSDSNSVHALGYARVSTHARDPQLHLDALTAAGVNRTLVDHVSGVATRRPELDKLLDHARSGDTIVIWHLDRPVHEAPARAPSRTWRNRGINLVSLNEQIDTTSANGRRILNHLASWAAFERDLLSARETRAGREAHAGRAGAK